MSTYIMDVKDQLKIANKLKVLELCLKYPEEEERIKGEYNLAKSGTRDLI